MTLRSLLVSLLALTHFAVAQDKPTAHETRQVEGWTVHFDTRLLSGADAPLGTKAQTLLRARLADILHVMPADKVQRLQQVPLWLELNHGHLTSLQYHSSADWLEKNGYPRVLAKSVHIPVVARFTEPRHQHTQPWSILHELAHAYHDQVLGFDEPRVMDCWQRYVISKHGERALHVNGRTVRHYGLTNAKEFFAEMTEAYFGTNDFTPFVHGQLKRDEPETHALLREIWGPTVLE